MAAGPGRAAEQSAAATAFATRATSRARAAAPTGPFSPGTSPTRARLAVRAWRARARGVRRGLGHHAGRRAVGRHVTVLRGDVRVRTAPTRATRAACAAATTRRARGARAASPFRTGARSGRLRFVRREPSEHRPVRRVLRGQPDLRRVRRRARVGQDVRRVPGEHGSAVPELPRAIGELRLRVLGPGGVPRRLRRGRGRVLRVRRRAQLGRDPGRVRRVPGGGRPGHGQGGELHGSGCDGVPFSTSRHDWCCDCDGEAGRRVGVLRGRRRGVRVVREHTVRPVHG